MESVDSISRDGPDTSIHIIHHKSKKNSAVMNYQDFKLTCWLCEKNKHANVGIHDIGIGDYPIEGASGNCQIES